MSTGSCRHCGYRPVGTGAPICPSCGGTYPNLNWLREILIGLVVIALIVAVIAFAKFVGPELVGMPTRNSAIASASQ
jgi:hypothetical protein